MSHDRTVMRWVTGRLRNLASGAAVPQSDGALSRRQATPAPSIIEGTTMEYHAGIDVSLKCASLCAIDAARGFVREAKVASEPEILTVWSGDHGQQTLVGRG